VDPRAGLDDVEKRKLLTLPGLELQLLGRPAHSQLLYRLRYPGSILCWREPALIYCYAMMQCSVTGYWLNHHSAHASDH
jgi:hypothetical protein